MKIIALLAFSILQIQALAQSKAVLSPDEFQAQISSRKVQVLDVRTKAEFDKGYIKDALHADWWEQESFMERTKHLDKSLPVYAYCASGIRSAEAAKYLRKKGYQVYELKGGTNQWKKEQKPLENPEAAKEISYSEYLQSIPSDGMVLVNFGAPWCPPCRQMKPTLDSMENLHTGIRLMRLEAGVHQNLEKELNVDGLPTFFFYNNKKEIGHRQGVISLSEITRQFESK